jgi:hypothetical protein
MVWLSNGLQGYTISVVRKNAKYIDLKRIDKAYKCDPESHKHILCPSYIR